ncbi:hypothetical protein ACSFA3_09105 [Variovorax sp. RHLX14]|uniref:hypothetical protein n=1 Tax=Variovorax sp. RHLX14 TaxID=1259731 RepID=UPI003F48A8FD
MMRAKQAGSMLIEIAASIAVLGLLAATSFGVLRDVNQVRQGRAAAALASQAKQLTLEFAMAHGRFPCPDLTGSGIEGDAAGDCLLAQSFGLLPTRTLGMDGVSAQSANRVLRYGISRIAPDADLGATATAGDPDPATRLLTRAERAAAYATSTSSSSVSTGQPYVPKPDAQGLAMNCLVPGDSPAFVISVGAPEDLGTAACFPIPNPERSASTSMGRHELVGWVRSKFRAVN